MNPSYRIVFYVSGHGFGHTSRAIEVIDAVLRAHPDAQIIVKTGAPARLFAHILSSRCELVNLQCDAGMVQIDSLNVDTAATIRQASAFQAQLPELAHIEASYLRETAADAVVGDIPPLAAAAARGAGIPSILIGNFTWDWIYDSYRDPEAVELGRNLRRTYQRATLALRLPMAGGFAGLEPIVRDIPFIARHSRWTRDEVRSALRLPPRSQGKPLVLMSFGGYGVAGLDIAALARLTDYTIATTDLTVRGNVNPDTNGLLYISEQQVRDSGLLYEDLVRGADIVVTKPGYGIISEAIANDTALLYTSRGDFVEYDVLVKEMPRYLRTQFIEQKDLLNGNWSSALRRLMDQRAVPEKPPLNGAAIAAGEILKRIAQNE
jgi:UDP:flavonoid glycosyltransferase YjiC (YdhE family)